MTTVLAEREGAVSQPGDPNPHVARRDASGRVVHPLMSQAGRYNADFFNVPMGGHTGDPDTRVPAEQRPGFWENGAHSNGGFWVYEGPIDSPLGSNAELGHAPRGPRQPR